MKTDAVVFRTHGPPDVLVREEIELDELGPRDVMVRVRAVALNHLDVWVRRGMPHLRLTYPHCLGSDVVGEVEARGPSARGVRIGDRGVSSAAIQIAKLHGARVIATVGSDAKVERARALGADAVVNYVTHDFVAEVRRLTDKRGADAVIDHIGGDVLVRSVLATASGGRIVTCGATAGHAAALDLRHVFFRQIAILGSTMGATGSLVAILEHVRAGRLRPVVDRVLSLWDAAEGHRILEAREAFGKVVLQVD